MIKTTSILKLALVSTVAVVMAGTASAQAPGSLTPEQRAERRGGDDTPRNREQSPASVQNQTNDNPCPEPKRALASTPDDMARIQEDITRFTLCVQRAQLLERLNELAEANIGTIDSALNLSVSAPNPAADGNATPGIMPSVPMPQLPESVSRALEEDDGPAASGVPGGGAQAMQVEPQSRPSPWRVRDIQGAGGEIFARLINDDGMMYKAAEGDDLPSGGGRVQSVSNTMVIIAKDGDTEVLKWVE